jgi:hypothetical protein
MWNFTSPPRYYSEEKFSCWGGLARVALGVGYALWGAALGRAAAAALR